MADDKKDEKINSNRKYSIEHNKWLSNALENEKISITGLAGTWPGSKNIYDLQANLYSKIDMITTGENHWLNGHPDVPERSGKMLNIEKFDAGFFGVNYKQADAMDPAVRIILEKSIEAIIDAGYNPSEFEGTKTGVFITSTFAETEMSWYRTHLPPQKETITGCSKTIVPNRVSYYLKLKGPSHCVESACSSSVTSLEHAYRAIKSGVCDRAIVGGYNILLHPLVSFQYQRLGVLSQDGSCKAFDNKGNGFVRSEGVGVVILQKSREARRIYANIVHAKTNCDGFKLEGITFPSRNMQAQLIEETLFEANVAADDLSYIEAHGPGTVAGDTQELNAIDQALCKNRTQPLLIGSVKSNLGHCENGSGLAAVTKIIIMMENGKVPANLHYQNPRKGIEALEKGRLIVATDCFPLPTKNQNCLVAMNNFGFGGSNGHVILEWNKKTKNNNLLLMDNLPRIVCVSGRTEESVVSILDDIKNRPLDPEYIRLYHQVFSKNIEGHLCKGYSIVEKSGEVKRSVGNVSREIKPISVVLTTFGESWVKIAQELSKLQPFLASLQRVNNILITKKLDIMSLIENKTQQNEATNNKLLYQEIGNMAVQIAILDLLKKVDLNFNAITGMALNEFVCGYYKETLTLEEVVDSIYFLLTRHSSKSEFCYFATICEQKMPQIPSYINVLQINKNNAIFTGNSGKLNAFAEILTAYGGFVKQISYNNVAGAKTELLAHIEKLLKKATVLEIGNGELQLVKKNLNFKSMKLEYLQEFLETLGSLFQIGHNCDLAKLYPDIPYPVSRSTPMISPLIKWDHSKNWHVLKYERQSETTSNKKTVSIDINDKEWSYLSGHLVDGRIFFPATGYLSIVWDLFSEKLKLPKSNQQIVFENCKFHKASLMDKDKPLNLSVTLQEGSGCFEILEDKTLVVTGRIFVSKNFSQINLSTSSEENETLLTTKDIYKELQIRDYNYSFDFQKIQKCNIDASHGVVSWENNWVTFLDNMLQLKLLQNDTRLLYVVTNISRFSIDTRKHLNYIKSFGQKPDLDVYLCKNSDLITCGGVEIRGMKCTSISKKGQRIEPLVLKHQFIPNVSKLNMEDAIRASVQIALENSPRIKIKVIEIIEETNQLRYEILAPTIYKILLNDRLTQPKITVLTKLNLNIPNASVENSELKAQTNCYLVVGTNLLGRSKILNEALAATANYGYILSRESSNFQLEASSGVEFLTSFSTGSETFVLIKKQPLTYFRNPAILEINDYTKFDWLVKLQNLIQNDESVILYADQKQSASGLLGFMTSLRRESTGKNSVRCVLIDDDAPSFNLFHPFYANHLKKGFAINVYKNAQWGTYRHVSLEELDNIEAQHCYGNTIIPNNLSTLKWIEGSLNGDTILKSGTELIYVYFSALNFKDIMLSTGRIQGDLCNDRIIQQYPLGFEFTGRTIKGKRVMGVVKSGGLSNMVVVNKMLLWPIPEVWTMEEATTVPSVYATLIYAMFMRTKLRRGESILIHSGSGGVGQAGITLALHFGCTVYTTVGTIEKRQFIKKRFPQIKDNCIGNSRDTSFEQMVLQETNGRGVDFVLNSLSEEKLVASIRCLARGGKFLEIGRFDLTNNNELQLLFLSKGASFHGIGLDQLFSADLVSLRELKTLIMDLIRDGAIQPITKTVFEANCIEDAFRSMTSGNHIGKVIIEIRSEEKEKLVVPNPLIMKGVPRYFCDPSKTSIIIGGLGGMGLELADWLVLRGATNLVLTSRVGIRDSYQSYRISLWKSYGVKILISTANITTRTGCKNLINEANQLGPVESIFNLAMELQDALLENQTKESFRKVLAPKAIATQYLDELTRNLCPHLRNFVVFSSAATSYGFSGQTSYAMANSVMERICEKRKEDGYPALAIQWGAIGDVGLVAKTLKNEELIGGIVPQRIASCMQLMDKFLKQSNPIVLSMVVATERGNSEETTKNLIEIVIKILGLKNLKTISFYSSLTELGLDSISTVELKHTLEIEFNLFLTSKEVRSLTLHKLQELQKELVQKNESSTVEELELEAPKETKINNLPSTIVLPSLNTNSDVAQVIFFPDIDGVARTLEPLSININFKVICLQYCYEVDSVEELAKNLLPEVKKLISKNHPFKFVSFCYGTLVALEIINLLEQKGYLGKLICIHCEPKITLINNQPLINQEVEFQIDSLIRIVTFFVPQNGTSVESNLRKCENFEKKVDLIEELLVKTSIQSREKWRKIISILYKRLRSVRKYKPSFQINSEVSLLKTKIPKKELWLEYKLSKLCANLVEVESFEENHVNIFQNMKLIQTINLQFSG